MPFISVIVPVYNGEKYISECIESILHQSFTDFELIVVDDGSFDSTGSICKSFEKVRYFYQENKGVSMARQKGVQLAKGEYITFIDSDDTIKSDFLATMLDEIKNCDIVCCNSVDTVMYAEDIYIDKDEIVTNKERIFKDYFALKRYTTCIWGKLFRKSLLEKIKFPKMEYAEDTYAVHQYFSKCKNIRLVKYAGYCYRDNPTGAMHSYFGVQEKTDMLKCHLFICQECIENYPALKESAQKRLTDSLFDLTVHFDVKDEIVDRAFELIETGSIKGKILILYKHFRKMPRKGLTFGIYTLNDNENYGNRLQNYAVHYIFSRYGKVYNVGKHFTNIKYFVWRLTGGKIEKLFPKKNYRVYRLADFNKRMKYSTKKANFYVYGSDQIWNPYYADESLINPYTKNNIAFCASFGISDIPKKYHDIFAEGLPKFQSVSVRENSGAKIFFDYTEKYPTVLPDPTMYVPAEHWRSISKCPKGFENKKYVLQYFLGEDNFNADADVEVVNANSGKFTVEEFLYLIDHSEYVITDSFHGCVFALIFGKKFIVKERIDGEISMQSRIDTLLEKIEKGIDFELERRKTDKFIISALRNTMK